MKEKNYGGAYYLEWEKIYESPDEVKDRKDLPTWFKNYLNHIGEKYSTSNGIIFTLKGMTETNEDFYYYGIDDNGKKIYNTCSDSIKKI